MLPISESATMPFLGEEISANWIRWNNWYSVFLKKSRSIRRWQGDLHKMMEYYLPMTEKLLDSYRELDAQPVAGENVTKTKHEIEDASRFIERGHLKIGWTLYLQTVHGIFLPISRCSTLCWRRKV